MIGRILLGLAMAFVGYMMCWKTEWFMEMLGRVPWAEQHLGGGSRFFYKLFGIAIILLGFLVVTNLFEMVIGGFIRTLFSF